jgi:hypothetical protein
MKYTNLAIAAAFLMPTVVSANVRGEDHDLQPYLHHNLRNLKGMMKDGMMGSRKSSKGSSKGNKGGTTDNKEPVDLEQFPQWATEEGYW